MTNSHINQLQDLVLSLKDPSDPRYSNFLAATKHLFPPDQWQKIISVDPEDQDLPADQQALLIPAKIVAALLARVNPPNAKTLKQLIDEYEQVKVSPRPQPPLSVTPPETLTPILKSASRLASLSTLKTPFSRRLPKINLTPSNS